LLDTAEEALDQIAVLVQVVIERSLDAAMAPRRNDGFDIRGREMFEDGIRVVSLVRAERPWLQVQQQRQGLGAIAGFTAREAKSGGQPQPFDERMDFGAQAAP
jgi:hypothetical protein